MILREEKIYQTGTWALISPEAYDGARDLAVELPVPTLFLGTQTSHKIRHLLRLNGFIQPGILILHIPTGEAECVASGTK